MTSNTTIESLSRLIAEKPALAEALKSVGDADQAVEILAKAGTENGIAVDKAGLKALLAERTAAAGAKLSDADLDQVAGGSLGGALLSIFSVGFGCATISISAAMGKQNCGEEINNFFKKHY